MNKLEIAALAMAGATVIAQGFLGEAGTSTWNGAGRILSSVRGRFRGDREANTALARVEEDPASPEAINALALVLASIAERDAQFQAFMAEAVAEAQKDDKAPQAVRTYSDFRDAHIGKVVNVDTVNGNLNF